MSEGRNEYMRNYRQTSESYMSEEAKAARAAYLRNWRANNKAAVKEYNQRYWQKKAMKGAKAE